MCAPTQADENAKWQLRWRAATTTLVSRMEKMVMEQRKRAAVRTAPLPTRAYSHARPSPTRALSPRPFSAPIPHAHPPRAPISPPPCAARPSAYNTLHALSLG